MRIIVGLIVLGFLFTLPVKAVVDPLAVPNNRFGIHIIDANDIQAAGDLVNSSGGDWGYVTLVIQQNHRDRQKWQELFDTLRDKHLIPLVRLATEPEGAVWQKPKISQAETWADFLNSLNWVVKNRYILLFNEPNHATEWGGEVNPQEYVAVTNAYISALKAKSSDFFVLPAGFDVAAPNGRETMDAARFFNLMHAYDSQIFTRFDGWSSHAYPNPAYATSPNKSGKTSIKSYLWELNYLKPYGLKDKLPLFITETGWNRENLTGKRTQSVQEKLNNYWEVGFNHIWTESNIVAITPFLLRYLTAPFTGFSWMDPVSDEPLPHYQMVQNLPKTAGQPVQETTNRLEETSLPRELVADSRYTFAINFLNTGQTIWDTSRHNLLFNHSAGFHDLVYSPFPHTLPLQIATLNYSFTTPKEPGIYPIKLGLTRDGQDFGETITREIKVIPPPSLMVKLQLWYKKLSSGSDFTLLIYKEGDLQKKISPVTLSGGNVIINNVYDVIPGTLYRFVITKPYYLPRQTHATLSTAQTILTFKRLLPFDFYPDGAFTFKDIWSAVRHPLNTLRLLSL